MNIACMRAHQRLLSIALLVVVVIPMLAVMAFASDKYPYTLTFTESGTKYVYGTKTDTGYSAGISILSSTFNDNSVKFRLQRKSGSNLSYWAGYYSSNGNYTLYYWSDVDLSSPPISVRVAAYANGALSISGNFQP